MNITELNKIIEGVTYKEGWVYTLVTENEIVFLQVLFESRCACGTNKKLRHYCRKWRISPDSTKSEFVQTLFLATLTAEEHEIREEFKYNNAAVFSPHFDVDKLVEIHDDRRNFDARRNSYQVVNS